MLEALRRGSTGLIAKLLLALLIVSFGIWGIADVFSGVSRRALATVGDVEIQNTEFSRVFQTELDGLSVENNRRITTEEARSQGVDRFVLNKMIGQAALKEHAQMLQLGLAPEKVVENLKKDENFFGPDGKFSRDGFDELIRRLGLTEGQFLKLRKEDELRRQLSGAILAATVAPKAMTDVQHAFKNETRSLQFFKIDAAKAVTIPDPDEAKLKAYYDANKGQFMTREFRKFAALLATVTELKKEVTVTDDELKASYADDKATIYDKPERRRLQQIAFKDRAAADAAREALTKGGKNFMDVAKDTGAKESDINLGKLSKKQLIDPKIAEAAFKLERDAISEVVEGRFATVLLRAIEIETGVESTFEGSKDKVQDKLASKKARDSLLQKVDLVEEGRNAGKTLKELAETLKLKLVEVAATDADSKTPDGAAALDHPNAAAIVKAVFRTSPGAESEPIELGNDGYGWIDVVSIDAAKERPLAEVTADLKTAVIDDEKSKALKAYADKMVDRAKTGEDFEKLAVEAGGKTETLDDLQRTTSPPGLTQEAVERGFALALNGATSAETVDRASRTIVKVVKITPAAAPSTAEQDALTTALKRELENDTLISYVTALQDKLGVSINEAEFKRITGADAAQP